ncbi:MoaD/ThiS family protein [Ghiorsea bivora]|uniref:MoaD/ThiS family protein n=1 Tax=Ghiorsea bivora TaxID=1485545 RepID=UPI0005709FBE|nr:MoaD/ThiS family protein [Ghiorsea bivora]
MIKVLFFGMVADEVGKQLMQVRAGQSLEALITELGCADIKPLLIAVNQEQVNDLSLILKSGDEVALMPPFSGG